MNARCLAADALTLVKQVITAWLDAPERFNTGIVPHHA
jgi:hypothetical protein